MKTLEEIVSYWVGESKAKTRIGRIRAATKCRRETRKNCQPWPMDGFFNTTTDRLRVEHRRFSANEREARRARDDKGFRPGYLRRLRKREKLATTHEHSVAGVTEYATNHQERTQNLEWIADYRSTVAGKKVAPVELPKIDPSRYPLLPIDEQTARDWTHPGTVRMVGQLMFNLRRGSPRDWTRRGTVRMVGLDASLSPWHSTRFIRSAGVTTWKNGRPVHYKRARNDQFIRSFGVIISPQVAGFGIGATEKTVTIPNGCVWDVDANGLRIVSEASGADYHPTAADVVRGDASREMLRKLHANEDARARIQRDEKDDAQRTADVYVCLADSIRAGNCLAGSQAWAERAGMDLQAHYRAAEVRLWGGSEPRVRLAITVARMRHEREMYQGYAVLAEHSLTG